MIKDQVKQTVVPCSVESKWYNFKCQQTYTECPLCFEHTFCIDHGCQTCQLKAKDANASMRLMPDDERIAALDIAEREAAYKAERPKVKKVKKWQQQTVEDAILNGSRATYAEGNVNVVFRPRTVSATKI